MSLHCSVVDFLAARGVSCRDFSEFISADEVRAAIRDASTEIDAVLARLDGTLGARMCAVAGMPRMALFHSLFKYLGQYHLAGLSCFERVLGSRLAQGDVCTVHFLHAQGTSTDPVFSFAATAERVCKQHGVGYAEDSVDRGVLPGVTAGVQRLYLLALRALRAPNRVLGKLTRGLSRWRAAQSGGPRPLWFCSLRATTRFSKRRCRAADYGYSAGRTTALRAAMESPSKPLGPSRSR